MLINWTPDNYRKGNLSWQGHEDIKTVETHCSTQLRGAELQIVAASQPLSRLGSNRPIFISITLCCRKYTLLTLATCGILRDILENRTAVKNLCSQPFHSDRFTLRVSDVSNHEVEAGWVQEPVWTLWTSEIFRASAGNRNMPVLSSYKFVSQSV